MPLLPVVAVKVMMCAPSASVLQTPSAETCGTDLTAAVYLDGRGQTVQSAQMTAPTTNVSTMHNAKMGIRTILAFVDLDMLASFVNAYFMHAMKSLVMPDTA